MKKRQQKILDLYWQYVNQDQNMGLISDLTSTVFNLIPPEQLLLELIKKNGIPDDFIENLFYVSLGNIEQDDVKKILTALSSYRYAVFDTIVTKYALLADLDEHMLGLIIPISQLQ